MNFFLLRFSFNLLFKFISRVTHKNSYFIFSVKLLCVISCTRFDRVRFFFSSVRKYSNCFYLIWIKSKYAPVFSTRMRKFVQKFIGQWCSLADEFNSILKYTKVYVYNCWIRSEIYCSVVRTTKNSGSKMMILFNLHTKTLILVGSFIEYSFNISWKFLCIQFNL